MLPKLAEAKTAVITQMFAAYNKTFGELGSGASIGTLCHQGVMRRNDEDITRAFIRLLKVPEISKYPPVVIWLDNCSGQNKNWTLYCAVYYACMLP